MTEDIRKNGRKKNWHCKANVKHQTLFFIAIISNKKSFYISHQLIKNYFLFRTYKNVPMAIADHIMVFLLFAINS